MLLAGTALCAPWIVAWAVLLDARPAHAQFLGANGTDGGNGTATEGGDGGDGGLAENGSGTIGTGGAGATNAPPTPPGDGGTGTGGAGSGGGGGGFDSNGANGSGVAGGAGGTFQGSALGGGAESGGGGGFSNSASLSGGGGGGGGGGRGATLNGAALNVTATGGNGGNGGDSGGGIADDGGSGGGGGNGVVYTGAGPFTVNGNITGGDGGTGGNATGATSFGGAGGHGGNGLVVQGGGVTVNVDAIIAGGNGGQGGTGTATGLSGAGGVGLIGSGLTVNMGTGSIAGGVSGATIPVQANAINFTGGANVINLADGAAALTGDIDVVGSLALAHSGAGATVANVISGSGSVEKTGTGLVVLSGANTYAGGTTITGGVLAVGADNNLGAAAGDITMNGGTLSFTGAFTVNSGRTVTLNNVAGNTFDTNGNAVTIAGQVTGAGGFTKIDTGNLTLTDATNNYTGLTTVTGGTLTASVAGALGGATGDVLVNGGTLDLNGATHSKQDVILTGGVIEDGTLNLVAFGQTGGDATNATINAAIEVIAIGGTINALGADGVAVENPTAAGIQITTTAAGDIASLVNAGIFADTSAGTGAITMTLAGTVQGAANGIAAAAGTGAVNIDVSANVTGLSGDGIGASGGGAITVTNSGGSGVTIQGTGPGNNGLTINTTATSGPGVLVQGSSGTFIGPTDGMNVVTGGAPINIDDWDRIQGNAGDGLDLSSFGGTIDVTDVLAILGTGGNGIVANSGNGGVIADAGDITVQGSGTGFDQEPDGTVDFTGIVGTGGSGISANALGSTTGGNILIGGAGAGEGNGDIIGQAGSGLALLTNRTGTISVINNANITGSTFGIFADTITAVGAAGDITIQGNDDITGNGGSGITANALGAAGGGNILIGGFGAGEGNGNISGTAPGVYAQTNGGTIGVIGNGDISGTIGIQAGSGNAAATGGDITIQGNGGITGTTLFGVLLNATGAAGGGNITVTGNGPISGQVGALDLNTNGVGTVLFTSADTVSATTGDGINSNAANGNQTFNLGHDVTANGAGARGLLTNSTGSGNIIINQTAGLVSATDTGIVASQGATGTGGVDIDIAGAVDSASTGISLSGTVAAASTLDVAGSGMLDGANNAVVTSLATLTVNNLGDVLSTGAANSSAINVFAGTTTFNNNAGGSVTGMLTSNAAGTLFVNNASTWTLNTGGVSTLTGAATFNNNAGGILFADGNTVTGLDTFNNNAGGILRINDDGGVASLVTFDGPNTFNHAGNIDMDNGVAGDGLVVGNLAASAGSTIDLNIDLSIPAPVTDTVTVLGNATGPVAVNFVNSQFGALTPDIKVLELQAGNTLAPIDSGLQNVGLVIYDFEQIAEDWFVTSELNLAPIGGIVGGVSTAQSLINSAVNRPSSAFVTTPIDVEADTCAPGGYGRFFGGASTAESTTTSAVSSPATSEIDLTYGGAQIGVDFGCFNIGGNGAAVNVGVLGGINIGEAKQDQFLAPASTLLSDNEFDSRYAGIYATFVKGSFFADAQVTHDWTDFEINSSIVTGGIPDILVNNQTPESQRTTVSGSAGYAFAFDSVSVVPSVGFAYSRTRTDTIGLVDNGGTLAFQDLDTIIGFASVAVAKTIILANETSAIQLFATGTAYNDFGDDQVVVFDDILNAPVSTTTENIGTFGEVSLGLNYRAILEQTAGTPREVSATLRTDFTFSDRLLGWRLTAQGRVQF